MNYSIIHKKNTCIISLTLTLSSDVPEKIRLNCQKPLTNHDPNSRNDSTTVQSSLAWLSYSCMSIYVYCIHQFNNCWDLRLFLWCVIMNIILSERSLLVDLWISFSPWLLSSLALRARIISGLMTFAFVTKCALIWWYTQKRYIRLLSLFCLAKECSWKISWKPPGLPVLLSRRASMMTGRTPLSLRLLTCQMIPLSMPLVVIVTSLLSIFDRRCQWHSIICNLVDLHTVAFIVIRENIFRQASQWYEECHHWQYNSWLSLPPLPRWRLLFFWPEKPMSPWINHD